MSIRRMNESFDKKFKEDYAPVEEIKEGYELLDGTKVELYKDYNKASARAKELGLKEAEYGDAYGVSYCMWNTSGDRNEDEEVIAYYKFEGRKPRPLTDDEAERIARDIGVQFEDFDESLKEGKNSYGNNDLQKLLSKVTLNKLSDANVDVNEVEVSINSPFAEEAYVSYGKGVANYQKSKSGEWVIHGGHSALSDSLAISILNDVCKSLNKYTNESCKEANEPDLTPKERREFITKMTTALMGDKFGYSRAEANDIAIKRADAQRKAMFANGYKESKKIPTKKGIDEDFSVKVDWAFLEWEIDAELGSAKVVLTEQNAGYAKFDITFADGFNIKGYMVGNPRQITVSVPALKAKKTCRDSYEIADFILSFKN